MTEAQGSAGQNRSQAREGMCLHVLSLRWGVGMHIPFVYGIACQLRWVEVRRSLSPRCFLFDVVVYMGHLRRRWLLLQDLCLCRLLGVEGFSRDT